MARKRLVSLNDVQHGCLHLFRRRGPLEHFGRVIPPLPVQGCEQRRSVCSGQGRPKKRASLYHTSSSATDDGEGVFARTPNPNSPNTTRITLEWKRRQPILERHFVRSA